MHLGNAMDPIIMHGRNISSDEIPNNFSLGTIYPNPFNPSTNIPFTVSEGSEISIVIYNIQGREIEKIVNEYKNPGYYNFIWNSNSISSGVYFVKMKSINGIKVKKILLLK
jgi:hypothetical protein